MNYACVRPFGLSVNVPRSCLSEFQSFVFRSAVPSRARARYLWLFVGVYVVSGVVPAATGFGTSSSMSYHRRSLIHRVLMCVCVFPAGLMQGLGCLPFEAFLKSSAQALFSFLKLFPGATESLAPGEERMINHEPTMYSAFGLLLPRWCRIRYYSFAWRWVHFKSFNRWRTIS